MVPSDRQAACSPTGMHGQNVASELARREPFAPRCWFWPTADQCAGARLLPSPVEARFSTRPFAQQFRGLASRPIPATASTLLAYIFETILRPDQARSVAALPPPLSFLRPRRVRSAHGTRCLTQSKDSRFVCEPLTPLQDLSILRDQNHGPR